MLCVSSNHHTIHLFSLAMKKKKVPLRKLSFSGEASVSRFRLPFPSKDKDFCICAFGPQPDSVIERSECTRQTCSLYLEITSDS
ncbi:unnamed protein product [Onchocerca flexuosa]|uniref:Ovule protein n=1 Tax=Onchocerca flexuosa TaxID=387005 RepID=A0A183HH86_9BILA|nr:unnamed protein product [Onchocerca flexuosa]